MKGLIFTTDDIIIATDEDLIHASLERLFFLTLGNILGNLDKGSRIPDYLDEAGIDKTILGIMEEMEILVKNKEPRVKLEALGADMVEDAGAVGVILYLKWSFIDDSVNPKTTLLSKIFTVS